MATKTFEELKQLAIQIRDEKTNKANTATRIGTQMIEHLNKLEQEYYTIQTVDGLVSEYNVSVNHPTSGIDGSNKYTLSSAIALVPEQYRTIGIKCSFVDETGSGECWEYLGDSWVLDNFMQIGAIKFTELSSKSGIEIINIAPNTMTIGSNDYFSLSLVGKRIAFKVVDTEGVIRKYAVVSKGGIDIQGKPDFYRFDPNKLYILDASNSFLEAEKFGCVVNEENAIGTGKITFIVEDYAKIEESLGTTLLSEGYNLKQDINVVFNNNTVGSNAFFYENTLKPGQEIAFCLIDKNKIINKYSVVTQGGNDIEYNPDYYRFESNKIYFVTPNDNVIPKKWGCYINAENAIGTGDVTFVVSTNLDGLIKDIRQNQKEIYVHNSSLGLTNTSEFIVKLSTASQSENYPANTFIAGKEYAFCLFTESTIVGKYALITDKGQDVVGNTNFYRFEPNKLYKVRPSSSFAGAITRCYINAENALGNGKAVFVIAPSESYLGVMQQLYDRTLSEDVIRLIGFDKLQKVTINENVTTIASNDYFVAGSFVTNKQIAFCLIDRNNSVEKFAFISQGGLDVEGNSDFYRFEPNKIYFATPTSSFVTKNTGCYVNAENAIGTGDVTFVVSTNLDGVLSALSGGKTSQFSGKTFAVDGDSLSATGEWQRRFSELTGAEYIAGYEKGGTATLDASGNCGMDRVLRLKEEHPDIDVIFVQNINDGNYGESADGELTDVPYMMTKNYLSSKIYGTSSEATDALLTEVSSLTPKIGAMVRLQYGTTAKEFTINNKATTNGNIFVNIDGKQYGVEINTSMEISDIQNAILAYDFSDKGYSDTADGSNAVLFSDTQNRGSSAPVVTIDAGVTGINFTESNATTVNYVARCFISKNISEWNDQSKWVATSAIKRYSLYKGLFGWLIENFPKAQIFFLLLPRNAWNSSTPKLEDGSYDFDKYRKDVAWNWLFECQKNLANYMGIPLLDVAKECGITVYNCSTFYPESNVHPKNVGYERWGETVARIIE